LVRPILSLFAFFLCTTDLHAQIGCDVVQFKSLTAISKKDSIADKDFAVAVKLVKELERDKCTDYTGKKNGQDYVIATLTSLFGEICLRKNDQSAVQAYINYMKRNDGSADEQIALSFERIFQKQPQYVLSEIGYDEKLLNQLEWGFVNNHSENPHLTTKNYMEVFFKVNPKIKSIYPVHKKQIDYLLHIIYLELKR